MSMGEIVQDARKPYVWVPDKKPFHVTDDFCFVCTGGGTVFVSRATYLVGGADLNGVGLAPDVACDAADAAACLDRLVPASAGGG